MSEIKKLVDLETILLIKPENLNEFLLNINSNLTINDNEYVITLLLSNIFAYFFVYLFFKLLLGVIRKFNRKLGRVFN